MNWIENINAGSTHRILLMEALLRTKGKVVELGCGNESTPYLREYCKEHNREFISYENHKEWAEKWGAVFVKDWDSVEIENVSMLFIDHSPAERRGVDLERFKTKAEIIVCHDTEGSGYCYNMEGFEHREDHFLFNTQTSLLIWKKPV